MKRFLVVLLLAGVFVPNASAVSRSNARTTVHAFEYGRVTQMPQGFTIGACVHAGSPIVCELTAPTFTFSDPGFEVTQENLEWWDCAWRGAKVSSVLYDSRCTVLAHRAFPNDVPYFGY